MIRHILLPYDHILPWREYFEKLHPFRLGYIFISDIRSGNRGKPLIPDSLPQVWKPDARLQKIASKKELYVNGSFCGPKVASFFSTFRMPTMTLWSFREPAPNAWCFNSSWSVCERSRYNGFYELLLVPFNRQLCERWKVTCDRFK